MKSIQEIFENNIFRIPDYQRGFSWKEGHLDDFWQDIINLRNDSFHYTGTLTMEKPKAEDFSKWKGDEWIIKSGSFKPFYIVDGQQRITTIVLLINILIDLMKDEEQYLYQSKQDLINKYIYKSNEKSKLQSFIFGYEIDDPSYEYLKTRIFKQESTKAANQPETSYTNNLFFADDFFRKKLFKSNFLTREKIFKKVTQQLVFDEKVIDNDLDIFVVFETMNNRGKPLTNLEKLKNRLIYLGSLMPGIDKFERQELRNEINEVWKTCYEYLGKNKRNVLNDDLFLRNHFIVYHKFEKTKEFPYHNLFKEIYTVQNVLAEKSDSNFTNIRKYIRSLQKASQVWWILNNPNQAFKDDLITSEEKYWLIKLNHQGFRVFAPLMISFYMVTTDSEDRVSFLKEIDSFIFLCYSCAGRRSNLGNSDFPYLANQLYNKKENVTVQSIIETLHFWTFGDEDEYGNYTNELFIVNIKDHFTNSKKNGFYDWPGLKYLLFEYEEFLQGKESSKVNWKTPNSIEHIYPQTDSHPEWKLSFKEFTPKQRKTLCNSLGNLVLLDKSKNSSLSNNSFNAKKNYKDANGTVLGYCIGSHSEIEVSQFKEWNPKSILKRGIKIFNFIQSRWGISFSSKEIRDLLFADENLIDKIKSS